jgi:hypothetical protein
VAFGWPQATADAIQELRDDTREKLTAQLRAVRSG